MVQKTMDKGTQMAGFVKMWVIKEKEGTWSRVERWQEGVWKEWQWPKHSVYNILNSHGINKILQWEIEF